jgi:hypothetical protein
MHIFLHYDFLTMYYVCGKFDKLSGRYSTLSIRYMSNSFASWMVRSVSRLLFCVSVCSQGSRSTSLPPLPCHLVSVDSPLRLPVVLTMKAAMRAVYVHTHHQRAEEETRRTCREEKITTGKRSASGRTGNANTGQRRRVEGHTKDKQVRRSRLSVICLVAPCVRLIGVVNLVRSAIGRCSRAHHLSLIRSCPFSSKNSVYQFDEVEVAVREATSSDRWGVTDTAMADIARATND